MATKKKPVLVRFQSNSYEKIKTLADLNTRSLSNMVEYMAEQYIKEYEEKNGQISLVDNSINIDNIGNGNYVNINK